MEVLKKWQYSSHFGVLMLIAAFLFVGCENNHSQLRGVQIQSDHVLKKGPEPFKFGYDGEDCKIETRSYSSHDDLCRGLKSLELNGENCALAQREFHFKKNKCEGRFQVEKTSSQKKINYKVIDPSREGFNGSPSQQKDPKDKNNDSHSEKSYFECRGKVDRHGRGQDVEINTKIGINTSDPTRIDLIPSHSDQGNELENEVQIFVNRKGEEAPGSAGLKRIQVYFKKPQLGSSPSSAEFSPAESTSKSQSQAKTDSWVSFSEKSEAVFIEYKNKSKNLLTDVTITCLRSPLEEAQEPKETSTPTEEISCTGQIQSGQSDSLVISGKLSSWDLSSQKSIPLSKNGASITNSDGVLASVQLNKSWPSVQILFTSDGVGEEMGESLRILSNLKSLPKIEMNQGTFKKKTLKCDLTDELNKETTLFF